MTSYPKSTPLRDEAYRWSEGKITRAIATQTLAKKCVVLVDPTAFAELSASLQHGSIDVFVLRDEGEQWMWRDVAFVPRQFGTDEFVLWHDAPSGLVIAVRTSLSAGDS